MYIQHASQPRGERRIYGPPPLPPTSNLIFIYCVCMFRDMRLWDRGVVSLWICGLVVDLWVCVFVLRVCVCLRGVRFSVIVCDYMIVDLFVF